MSLLSVKNLTMRFGGITAVSELTFAVEPGQIYSVIGPNGAGKTTVFNAITGIYQPTTGDVQFAGHDLKKPWSPLTGVGWLLAGLVVAFLAYFAAADLEGLWGATVLKPYEAADAQFNFSTSFNAAREYLNEPKILNRSGIAAGIGLVIGILGAAFLWFRSRRTPDIISHGGVARTFQNIRLFQSMTVLENVLVGMDRKLTAHPIMMALGLPRHRHEETLAAQKSRELLAFVGLNEKKCELAKNLPYGDQRRLEIARALATEPKLLLLDEPAAGMNPSETSDLMNLIRKIRDRGITVLLIEHHMNLVMGISDRVAVLDYGVKIAEGSPLEVSRDPKVIEAYLGKEEVH